MLGFNPDQIVDIIDTISLEVTDRTDENNNSYINYDTFVRTVKRSMSDIMLTEVWFLED